MKPSDQLELTDADKARYEQRISKIDLNDIPQVIRDIPKKIDRLISNPDLLDYQLALVSDISKLLNLLKDIPELNDDLKRRIVFALEYFLEEQDDIILQDPIHF